MKLGPFCSVKVFFFLITALSVAVVSESLAEEAQEDYFGARYKEGQGIEVSDETKVILDLQTAEVEEQRHGSQSINIIPVSSLLNTVTGKYVYVVNGSYYLRTKIETGSISEQNIQVLDGLFPGDEIVVRPVNSLWYAELQALRGGKACADGH